MFTGLIEEVGRVIAVPASEGPKRLRIAAPRIAAEAEIGRERLGKRLLSHCRVLAGRTN